MVKQSRCGDVDRTDVDLCCIVMWRYACERCACMCACMCACIKVCIKVGVILPGVYLHMESHAVYVCDRFFS